MEKLMGINGLLVTLFALSTFLMLLMVPGCSYAKDIQGIGPIGVIHHWYIDENNTIYLLSDDDNITVISTNGELEWTYHLPYQASGPWTYSGDLESIAMIKHKDGSLETTMEGSSDSQATPIGYSDNTMYFYLVPTNSGTPPDFSANGMLVAISNGQKLWELPLRSRAMCDLFKVSDGDSAIYSDASVMAKGDRVYIHHDYNETVVDRNGDILWNIEDVSDPASVDDNGFVYCVRSSATEADNVSIAGFAFDHRSPSSVIDAYYPNGTLYWERSVDSPLARQSTGDRSLPLYNDDTIYAPMYNGVTAIDRNGNIKWTKTYNLDQFKFDSTSSSDNSPVTALPNAKGALMLYTLMPFDSRGNLYLQIVSSTEVSVGTSISNYPMFLIAIGPVGNEISRQYIEASKYVAAGDGICYTIGDPGAGLSPSNLTDLPVGYVFAYDAKSGRELWNRTFTPTNPTTIVLNESNAPMFLNNASIQNQPGSYVDNSPVISTGPGVGVVPGNGIVYVSYMPANWEAPLVLGQSHYVYAGGVYALNDKDGMPLWYVPVNVTGSYKWDYITNNGTIIYQTPDGRIGVIGMGAAAGLTLTALYLFYHFFCAGAVSRAKARMNKNENRNKILDFIRKNPGMTMYEISRGVGLNLGTVNYHMLILSLNHRIVLSRMDSKYVRYFTNSNAYTKDEQLILSLMRRGTVSRMLCLILKKPGLSNMDIARELDIKESTVCRFLKELTEKGIVNKVFMDTKCSYSIRDGYAKPLEDTINRFNGQ